MKKYYAHAASVFPVADVSKSVAFYRDLLGFEVGFLWEDPPSYAVLNVNDRINLHLSLHDPKVIGTRNGLYIFVHHIDELYDLFKSKGVIINNEIGDRDYEMRDFDILDPDGNMITFGCALERIDQAN